MSTPLSHVGQTARPEDSQQQQDQQQDAQRSQPRADGPAGHRQQQQADFAQRPADQQRERQQHQVDAEDDPASDANTESANHPNDE